MKALKLYLQPRMLVILLLGFVSGLPLALSASTLSIWLTESGVSKAAIGLFAAIGTPYALKFLWAPLIDGVRLPLLSTLGQRRSWLALSQILLIASLIALGFSDPAANAWQTAFCALLVAISSATQDMVIDAYRVEFLPAEEQAAGAATIVLGYRLGMMVSGAGALLIAAHWGWTFSYIVMAALVPLGLIATLFARTPSPLVGEGRDGGGLSAGMNPLRDSPHPNPPPQGGREWFSHHVIAPFTDFMQRDAWVMVLAFIILFKLGDAFMGAMASPFYVDIGFSKEQIAAVSKLYGVIATIVGGLLGGALVARFGMMRVLWLGGISQAATNLIFMALAHKGADVALLATAITADNLAGGIATAAFVAYLSSLVNLHFTATQYALLSAVSSLARTWLSTPAGLAVETLGWEWFFAASTLFAIPGLALLYYVQKHTTATLPQAAAT